MSEHLPPPQTAFTGSVYTFFYYMYLNAYSWFQIKGTLSVHSFNGDYLSMPSAHRYNESQKNNLYTNRGIVPI